MSLNINKTIKKKITKRKELELNNNEKCDNSVPSYFLFRWCISSRLRTYLSTLVFYTCPLHLSTPVTFTCLHLSSTPVTYTCPLHLSSTPVCYTCSLHLSTPVFYTCHLHLSTPVLYTCLFLHASVTQGMYTRVPLYLVFVG